MTVDTSADPDGIDFPPPPPAKVGGICNAELVVSEDGMDFDLNFTVQVTTQDSFPAKLKGQEAAAMLYAYGISKTTDVSALNGKFCYCGESEYGPYEYKGAARF